MIKKLLSIALVKLGIIAAIILLFVLSSASSALALNYYVGGAEMAMSNPSLSGEARYWWTGIQAMNYVMREPKITYRHVNSILMFRYGNGNIENRSGYEVGWRWPAGGEPQWFAAKLVNGVVYPHYGSNAQKDSNHLLQIFINNGVAYMYVDNTLIWNDGPAMWAEATLEINAERQNDNETNYGHFWALKRRNHAFAWNWWSNLKPAWDDDNSATNGYSLQKISNTEAKSIKFDYDPFYRLYSSYWGDHFYTMDDIEKQNVFTQTSYIYEGVDGFMMKDHRSGSVALHYSYNPYSGDHFYTTSWAEAHSPGYIYQKVAGYIYPSSGSGRARLYRSYNPSTGDHFYTTSYAEAHSPGYNYEGPIGYVKVL